MKTKTIDCPHRTLEGFQEIYKKIFEIRLKCRDKDYNAGERFSRLVKALQEIEDEIIEDIPEWNKIMNEDLFPDGRPSIDEHLSNAYCDAIKR